MHWSESGPFTRSSKRRQSGPVGEEPSLSKRGKPDPESSEPSVDPAKGKPPPASSFQGSCKPIQALLAKSVGNKVTLISHPTAAVMARVQERIKTSVTLPPVRLATTASATGSPDQVVYTTSGGVGLLRRGSTSVKTTSDHKSTQHVVILPSNLLIQSAESKSATSLPKTKTYLSNASGFTIPENKVPVQQVAPLKDPSTAVVAPNLRSVAVPKRTSEPKASANSTPAKPDAKQELRTVCIRDSQSILVTTRGGNTGVVKVQTSESGTGASPASPVFTISPQLQAFLVSKSSASRSKDVDPASSSTFLSPSALSKDAKTSIPGKSDSDGVLVTAKDIQGLKCGQKRTPPGSRTPDQSAFQKVFLVSPSPASNASPSTSACTLPGSRVMFISNSALTIPKEASEVNASSTSTPALKVIPKLGTTLSCASSGTSIGVPGLMSRILNPSAAEASVKATPVIVSRVPATSTSSGPHVGPKTCSVASRSPTGNAEGSLKAPSPVDGKTLTFSTLGTGHMASSALLSVVKPDVPLSISTLSTFHCKPGLTSGSSTTSYSGCLINKHTTPPVDVTANKTPMIASSHSLIKTASSAVSGPLPLTPPMAAKSVQEKIVINTTAPLAPGTQLLINNTRFVVPSQGLGPGSHVLLINSCPGGLASPGPRGPNSSTSPSVIQGVRLVTPVRLPSPKAGPPDRVPPLSTRAPLNVSLRPDVVRLPVFQTVSQGMVVSPKETSPPQGGLLSTTSPMLLQGRPSQNQVAQTMPPMKTAIARHSPMVSVPPMSSTISRMQKLPVAMVPPIGGHSSATPIASVPPSMNSVIMTPCPPIRAVQPWTIGKPAILPLPLHGQNTSPSKLLLSPDGAILNIVQPSSIQVLAKPMDARVVGSSSSSVPAHRLNTNDPLRKPDPTGRPDL